MNSALSLGRLISWVRGCGSFVWQAEASLKGVTCGKNVMFYGRPIISLAPDSKIILSDEVRINSTLRGSRLGCFQPSVLRTLGPNAELRLGARVGMSGAVICAGKQIVIGDDTIIGSGAMLFDNDFHALNDDGTFRNEYVKGSRPIKVGKSCFIGTRAIVLKGVEIGDRAIVGAGSVLSTNVPSGAIFAGNPARQVGVRKDLPPGLVEVSVAKK